MSEMTYNRERVSAAVNAGADLVRDDLVPGCERDDDLINMVANAALTLLDDPEICALDEVIRRNYDDAPEEVRGWWPEWS